MYSDKKYAKYRPLKREANFILEVEEKFSKAKRQRERGYRHLDDMSINQFIKLSRDQYNGYVPNILDTLTTRDPQNWHSRIFRKKTRKKVVASAASLVASGIGVDIAALKADNRFDREFSKVTEMLYDWSSERELQESVMIRNVLQGFITGTGIMYEEIAWDERMVNEIEDIDLETGKITTTKANRVDFKGPRVSTVRLEEFYPLDVFQPDMQKQPGIIWRQTTDYDTASASLAKYKNWKAVLPDSKYFLGGEDDDKEEQEDYDGRVEIVRYWCRATDTFAIICNRVLLTEYGMGFPYPHKNYPFTKFTPFLFADTDFFYGDSLAHINLGEQKTINDFINIMVDSEKLKNKPPVATTSEEIAKSDVVIPGAMVAMRTGEEVNIMEAFTQGTSQGLVQANQMLESQMDENSIDPLVSGQTPSGDPTATEVKAIVGSAEQMKGLTEKLYAETLIQFANLRVPNLFWFLVNDEEYERVVIDHVKVKGKEGSRHIMLTKGADLPSPLELMKMEADMLKEGDNVEMVYVNKDKVNDFRFHITISAQPKPPRNSAGRLQRAIQKYQIYSQNPIIDQKKNTERLVEALGDDPDEMLQQEQPMPEGAPSTVDLPKQNLQFMEQADQQLMNV